MLWSSMKIRLGKFTKEHKFGHCVSKCIDTDAVYANLVTR